MQDFPWEVGARVYDLVDFREKLQKYENILGWKEVKEAIWSLVTL